MKWEMINIKKFESFLNDSVNIKKRVDLSKINMDFYIQHSLYTHSSYIKGETKVIDLLNKFENILTPFISENNEITLYRMVMLDSIQKLKKPYGVFWAYKENYAQYIDDEGYEGDRGDTPHILKGNFAIKDIDWTTTFELYLMNEFMEGEIRVFEKSEPIKLEIKKVI